ncbi:Hypothetical protein R9X50_00492100 [Acrodontium crateriforme]|uniref:TM7S3/TM198-like domain-containing protein n=1 Tax=Acrodontium crateriforme TaxID=150365 RepID=A0AAQ3M8P6_9PEZI|nr:Hypothetical protein R9X50_00492100 [Acrodontium crateriforme]
MRLPSGLTALVLALCCAEGVFGGQALARQNDNAVSTTNSPSANPTTSSGSSSSTTQASSSANPSSSFNSSFISTSPSQGSQNSTAQASATSSSSIAASQTTHVASSATSAPSATPVVLPIQPQITPAIGIAGVLLMISGVALTFIGIKHKWLHIFLSVMLLSNLAVAVLILYVMNPPVSDAIQGAYFVAIAMTGLIIGALSLIFQDVTEGFGCLLGGFTIGMWFLVLRDGGLIQNTVGRAILIAAFSVVGWSLAFSHYTRNYGLIVMTAFGGATVTILGIDCFSKAGLKEFWIYLWNLNDNEFPIGTTTYPITRGIRVEIAGIIVIFLGGILSQIKVWRIVKEKRQKRDEERKQNGEDRDQQDEAVGREIEARTEVERAQWERLYDEKNETRVSQVNLDSGVGTSIDTTKHPESIRDREYEEMEMGPMPKRNSARASYRNSQRHSRLTIASASNEHSHIPAESQEDLLRHKSIASTARTSLEVDSHRASSTCLSTMDRSHRQSAGESPPIPPLPFSLPTETSAKRKSAQSTNAPSEGRVSEFDFGIPDVEDDRASSIAATADDADRFSDHRLSIVPAPYELNPKTEGTLETGSVRHQSPTRHTYDEEPVLEEDDEVLERPVAPLEEPTPASPPPQSEAHHKSISGHNDDEPESANASFVGDLSEHLPQKMSKVAMTYRTNEWAKHITEADMPEHDDVRSTSPGIHVDPVFAEEAAHPVDVEALNESTFETPEPAPTREASKKRPKSTKSQNFQRMPSIGSMAPVYSVQRSSSQPSLKRQSSANSLVSPIKTPARMTPFASETLVESPAEDAQSVIYRNSTVSAMNSSNNLLDQRQGILSHKPTTVSFFSPTRTPSEAAYALERGVISDDDLTLAERKAMMAGSPIVSPTRRGSVTPSHMNTMGTVTSPGIIYDSHQPKRTNTVDSVKQNATLTKWRQSLASEGVGRQPQAIQAMQQQSAQQALLSERRQAAQTKQQERNDRESKQFMMEQAMRSGRMNSTHRNALSMMEAKIPK